jgi:hypothetical protein
MAQALGIVTRQIKAGLLSCSCFNRIITTAAEVGRVPTVCHLYPQHTSISSATHSMGCAHQYKHCNTAIYTCSWQNLGSEQQLLPTSGGSQHSPSCLTNTDVPPATRLAGLTNLGSVVTIVVANKVVMSTYKFSFPVCLTWFHSIVTALGMMAMAAAGMFQVIWS